MATYRLGATYRNPQTGHLGAALSYSKDIYGKEMLYLYSYSSDEGIWCDIKDLIWVSTFPIIEVEDLPG